MQRASVLELKKKVLRSLNRSTIARVSAGAQGLVPERLERRLAVGYSQVKKEEYRLELRVQKGRGPAYAEAEKVKELAKGEANIDIVPRIEIPSTAALLEASGKPSLIGQQRPLHMGLSVGHAAGGAGTLGCFVETPDGEGFLSNQHVLAPIEDVKTGAHGDRIYQPGRPDRPRLTARDEVARLSNYGVVDRSNRNAVDWAIATLSDGVAHEGNRIPTGLDCPFEGKVVQRTGGYDLLGLDALVYKVGRTTGFTIGLVSAVALDNVPVWTPQGNVIFDNVIEVRWLSDDIPFSAPGDSGSAVFTEDESDLVAIGLHFAGGRAERDGEEVGLSFACSLTDVLSDCDGELHRS
jgi:hypothetical protein